MGYFFVCNQLYFDPGCHCEDKAPYVLPFKHLQDYLAKHPDALDAVMEN